MKLSVAMITYNHAKYIQQAIESILDQVTSFEFELIISNDCSTDDTDDVIRRTLQNHPKGNRIKYFAHPKNIGMMVNFKYALDQCSGDFVALCEGDDFWTDLYKLQKQVDFLEQNPEFSICFHKVSILENEQITEDIINKNTPEITSIKDLAQKNYMHTPSVVYRNGLIDEFPDYFVKSPIGDYFLHMLNAKKGLIKFINQDMAVYRVHNSSYWSSKKQRERELVWIDFINHLKVYFPADIQKILNKQILKIEYKAAKGFKRWLLKLRYMLG